jgi:APA family basic amino acid/polyamine antiporter
MTAQGPAEANVGGAKAGELRRSLGTWGGAALLVGTMIGGGIFRTPGVIAQKLNDPGLILLLWFVLGMVSICGALTLAELATMLPQTGGTYVYLRAAYGDSAAFVFGWLYLLAAIPSGVAALAVFFGELLLGAGSSWIPIAASGTIVFLSVANILGVRLGSSIQIVLTVVKVAALLGIILAGFLSGRGDTARWIASPGEGSGVFGVMAAAQSVIFTYNGWVYVSLVSGEIRDPEKRLTRIILGGTGAATALYLLANLAYLYVIPLAEMRGRLAAVELMRVLFGETGARIIGVGIMCSVAGSLNGIILAKARVAYALARDGLTFSFLGKAHPTRATPYVSILIQGLVSILLVFALNDPASPGRLFSRLTTYFVVVEWLALLFAIAAVFVLRRKMPDAPRPYRTPGYPWVPLIFVAGTFLSLGVINLNAWREKDYSPAVGLAIVLAGFPVYWIWRRSSRYNPLPKGDVP